MHRRLSWRQADTEWYVSELDETVPPYVVANFTPGLWFGVVVVGNVPALVCARCGEDGIADEVAARIEESIVDARKKRFQVEVATLS
jgi:hypothetical protein